MPTTSETHPWYREPWPWLLMAGPAAVIVAGVYTTALAIRSDDGLVAEDYYKQGLAINQVLAREQHARDAGISAEIKFSEGRARVVMTAGAALPPTLRLRIVHPTRAGDAQGHVIARERVLSVAIPKGIRGGQHIRLSGQGGPGIGDGKPGDLYLQVEMHPHRLYRADGRDVYLDLPVAPWEAALGASVKAPTPEGSVDIKIPPKSRPGGKLRLKGRGLPGNPAGDLYVVLQIALPPAESEAAMAAYRKMAEELPFDPRATMGM